MSRASFSTTQHSVRSANRTPEEPGSRDPADSGSGAIEHQPLALTALSHSRQPGGSVVPHGDGRHGGEVPALLVELAQGAGVGSPIVDAWSIHGAIDPVTKEVRWHAAGLVFDASPVHGVAMKVDSRDFELRRGRAPVPALPLH